MKGKTILVLAISFAFILGTMLVGVDGVFAAKDDKSTKEDHEKIANTAIRITTEEIQSGKYVVILDEINYAGTEGVFAAKDDEKKIENKEKKEKKVIILYKSDKADKKDEKGKKHKDKEKHVEKLKGKNAKIKYVYDIIPGIAATVDEDSIIDLMNDEDVLAVIEDVEVHTTLQDSIPQINADDVHATGITGTGVKVCIVDTGVDDSHPALNSLVSQYDFVNDDNDATDDNFHGTHVAGIVASTDSFRKGVAPGVSLMAAKVLDSSGTGSASDVISGIEWCVANGADIISMSLGAGLYTGTCDFDPMAAASNNAVADGVVVIASSGNNGVTNGMVSPSCASDVISVGSVSKSDVRADISNGGRDLDVVAPGVSITSLKNGGSGYRSLSGTSMATPHVSGTAALLLESNSELTPDSIRKILRSSSVDLGSIGFDNLYGHGRINANDALAINANLFVSAENSVHDNYVSGPQVIEVVVIDSDINDTNEGEGEPDVTVNGKTLRMVQASDGNWYGYFADKTMAETADATSVIAGEGLDFGTFCDPDVTIGGSITGSAVSFEETVGIAFPLAVGSGGGSTENTVPGFGACNVNISGVTTVPNNVVREAKEPNPNFIDPINGPIGVGQIDIDVNAWPFIQLYNLNPTNPPGNVVAYHTGSGTQSTTLTFGTVDHLVGIELDKSRYTQLAHVRVTISDLWLNIDPTDEDSWTFGTNPIGGLSTNYQVFDENGFAVGDTSTNTDSNLLTAALSDLMCTDNCVLIIDPNTQNAPNFSLTLFDNADSEILGTDPNDPLSFRTSGGNLDGKIPVTLTELTPNSGVFGTYDEQNNSILKITDNAHAGISATINYNETPSPIDVYVLAIDPILLLDSVGSSGWASSLTIGTDGFPIISYVNFSSSNLKVVHCTNVDCSTNDTPLVLDSEGNVRGENTSLAIGTDGFPIIAYYDFVNEDLKVVHCTNVDCSTNDTPLVLDSEGDVGENTSITIGTDGFPIIAYHDKIPRILKVVHCTNVDCSTNDTPITLDPTSSVGRFNSIAIGTDGFPVISYDKANSSGNLRLIHCTSVDCSTNDEPLILENASHGWFNSLAIGTDGFPIISYHDHGFPVATQDLKLIHCTSTDCTTHDGPLILDSEGDAGWQTSLAIGTDGFPIISYWDRTNEDLKLVHCTNIDCSTTENTPIALDTAGDTGRYPSLAIGTDGFPVISYLSNPHTLKLVHCLTVSCEEDPFSDNIPPIVSLTGSSSVDVVQNDIYSELGATCLDNIDGQINGNVVISGDVVDTTAEISTVFTIDYDCDDSFGNSATTVQRTVTIVAPDTTAPVITLNGPANVNVIQGKSYFELGATCFDNADGQINGNIVISGDTVDPFAELSTVFTIDYDCDDSVGNSATTVQRDVTVILTPLKTLFVSAENSQFDNYMSGPQVIEVVVIDSDINDTDEAKGEPDVTVNDKILRMVQAVDGNWYGYFADRAQAIIADGTTGTVGEGLDFGSICTNAEATTDISSTATTVTFSDTTGVAYPYGSCSGGSADASINVVRENKDPSTGSGVPSGGTTGQIGIESDTWPFIQLYTLNPTGNVIITYNKGGGAQSVTLTFDTVDQFANLELDRNVFPRGAHVHVTITDTWLNIDPTDEDSWTFGTNATLPGEGLSTNYQVFNENGGVAGAGTPGGIIDISATLSQMMIEDNGVLILDVDAQDRGTDVVTLQDNDDSSLVCGATAAECAVDDDDVNDVIDTTGLPAGSQPITITELFPNSGVFGTYDESDVSVIITTGDALRGTSATIDYNETPTTILIGFDYANVDIQPIDSEWDSGEEIPVFIIDGDANKNSRQDEDLDLNNPNVDIIPALKTGDPFTLGEAGTDFNQLRQDTLATATYFDNSAGALTDDSTLVGTPATIDTTLFVQQFSDRAMISSSAPAFTYDTLVFDLKTNAEDLKSTVLDKDVLNGFSLFNIDVRSLSVSCPCDVWLLNDVAGTDIITDGTGALSSTLFSHKILGGVDAQSLSILPNDVVDYIQTIPDDNQIGIAIEASSPVVGVNARDAVVADFFSFGFLNDGLLSGERIANQIIRIEAEETGDNTSRFEASLEFVMITQLNILDESTYTGLSPIADEPTFIVIEDLTDEDAPRVNYADLAADGTILPVADQEEAPTHSGIVSFDADSYKIAGKVTITVEDLDLNVDSDLIEIYTVVADANDDVFDQIGRTGLPTDLSFGDLGRLLDITYDEKLWTTPTPGTCDSVGDGTGIFLEDFTDNTGLLATGFILIETHVATGVFRGDFLIPELYCPQGATQTRSTTGLDIEVNYVDFRDASGEIIEVGDSAGVRANTGSVNLDRTVYPIPFGVPSDFDNTDTSEIPNGRALFPIHPTGMSGDGGLEDGEYITDGDLIIHIRVNDPDFDITPNGLDSIARFNADENVGPIKISVIRGPDLVVLAYAGNPTPIDGTIQVGTEHSGTPRQLGPIIEIAPDAGIFEIDVPIRYTDGPASSLCPITETYTSTDGDSGTSVTDRFENDDVTNSNQYCILQGDILQVEYTDPADASGDPNTVTDSATFDLRNGVLQSDKSVYIIGSDMILTLIEPDFNLDTDDAESYDLDLIEWDSDSFGGTIGDAGGFAEAFDPEPSNFRETGDSTGIFQVVLEMPVSLGGANLQRGEEITLSYLDWSPSNSDYVGKQDTEVSLTIFTSNFGTKIELDQKVYTWTDKVFITIVAPDHNFDSDLIDNIGETPYDPITISTREHILYNYKLVETGTDTGIFTGEIILTGFCHDADGDPLTGSGSVVCSAGDDTNPVTSGDHGGPTDGLLESLNDDGLTVAFEFSEDQTVVGSALIRWSIGEIKWSEPFYPAINFATGVVRVIDSDMNLNPTVIDHFIVDVWSDSDAQGIDLHLVETNQDTGIFEGTVFFTTTDESTGHKLKIAEGDFITVEYEDNTLPDPYTINDELDLTATSQINSSPPLLTLENARIVDAFGNLLNIISINQQVQIASDIENIQTGEQSFAYAVIIFDETGSQISEAWITGVISAGQLFTPALSWVPVEPGNYLVRVELWNNAGEREFLADPLELSVFVNDGEVFIFSKNSDFSTDDRDYETSDTLHLLAFTDIVDTNNMKKAEYKIQDSKKNRLKGNLDFNPDGSFTSSVSLASLEPGTVKVEIKLEDNTKKKFQVKENIIISGEPGSEPPTEEFFKLSKNSDFLTEDREFETSDTVHILVFSPVVDTDNMKKAEYKIQVSKKVKLQGKLTLNADGVYSASVSLEDLNAGTAKVELKLEDKNKNKFNVKENITIS